MIDSAWIHKLFPHQLQARRSQKGVQGFTLIETLIAGLLLTLVMTGVGRLSLSALASSSNLAERRRIETAIDNHIQRIQQVDSLLRYEDLPSNHRSGANGSPRACRYPAEYLATVLSQQGSVHPEDWTRDPKINGNELQLFSSFPPPSVSSTTIHTEFSFDNDRSVMLIHYKFEAPESNIGEELRSIELSPNFQSYCTPYEATTSP